MGNRCNAEKILIGIIIVMAIFLVVVLNIDTTGHKMKFYEDEITINGEVIKADDIKSIKLLENVHIGNKINGTSTITYLRGIFEIDKNKKATVYVYNNKKPYIKIITKNELFIYNDKDSIDTVNDYNELINRYNIKENSKVNEDKFLVDSNDNLIVYLGIIPGVLIFICLGIYAFKRKTPMFFWAGVDVSSEEISDIKAYNKANGIMWICYGLLFLLIPILGEQLGSMVLVTIIPFLIVTLMLTYKFIYNKYKVK
ncbi:MAG: PH domain-containing protein [Paraclostridium sordellii]